MPKVTIGYGKFSDFVFGTFFKYSMLENVITSSNFYKSCVIIYGYACLVFSYILFKNCVPTEEVVPQKCQI